MDQLISEMNQQMSEMRELLKIMHEKVEIVDSKIDMLIKKTENVEKDCDQMRDHIQFVESTYNVVRKPLNYLTNRINNMFISDSYNVELPQLENK